jgi:8-amino-7-oxononanoate synthase
MTIQRVDPLGWIDDELEGIRDAGLERSLVHLSGAPGPEVTVDGRSLVHLCSNNYLGLAAHPAVTTAAAEAAHLYGAGAGGSRLISGGTSLHRTVEERLAAFKAAEDCVVFSSGYLANLGTIPSLAGAGDEVFSDELNHASVIDACRLARARVRVFRHADAEHLDALLSTSTARRKLVVTDTVFSMDGDVAPLPAIVDACERHGAMLMVDEAHATGVLGPGGGGAVEQFGLAGRVPIVMGTLSKALGSAGGFVCGSSELCALLRNRARTFIFDTAPPAPAMAAALAALDAVQRSPDLVAAVHDRATRLAAGLRAIGLGVAEPPAAIIPVVLGDARTAASFGRALRDHGVLAPAIRPPSVPPGTSRIRATVMASHTDAHLDRAIEAFRAALR